MHSIKIRLEIQKSFAGTGIRKLEPIEEIIALRQLDIRWNDYLKTDFELHKRNKEFNENGKFVNKKRSKKNKKFNESF